VVAAAEDRLCPFERHREIHELVGGSELLVVPGAPHLVALSHPHRLAEAAVAWLQEVNG
jgi:pimeloyl-ACP methyl ester carboxylesterase